jgi:hypothetical protein
MHGPTEPAPPIAVADGEERPALRGATIRQGHHRPAGLAMARPIC